MSATPVPAYPGWKQFNQHYTEMWPWVTFLTIGAPVGGAFAYHIDPSKVGPILNLGTVNPKGLEVLERYIEAPFPDDLAEKTKWFTFNARHALACPDERFCQVMLACGFNGASMSGKLEGEIILIGEMTDYLSQQ